MDRRLGRAHRDLDAAHDCNQELERELDLAGSEIDILRTQIWNQEREINDLRDYLATSDHSLNRVRDTLRASENALTAARSDNADLNALRSEKTHSDRKEMQRSHPPLVWKVRYAELPPACTAEAAQDRATHETAEADRDPARDEATTSTHSPSPCFLILTSF
ncbi:hypothetical protein JG688_00015981 [Phytophthora aleatoria]|uniref:Uncharacterized protein n=1 Tax=Phytophthora aleatoria TaxID=2496075 RepID=A0A8J5IEV4_9STRA|nr:hypothetical protein JG688_00015981 [Phytophthora aleatoria]